MEHTGIKLGCVATDILGKSGRDMLNALVSGTTDPELLASANRFELSEELIALLAGREWLLVFDEAQWLNRECIEYLRHLHDHPRTKFSLLLVGGDGCWRVLSREPMLRSRIYRRVRFAPMRPTTVLDVIPG